jgi:predicted RNA-binding Zn ribbon-like protein
MPRVTRNAQRQSFADEGFGLRYAWIDFVNSEHADGFGTITDHLQEVAWLSAFIEHWGLAGTPEDLPYARAAQLRSMLRSAAEGISSGKAVPRATLREINMLLSYPCSRAIVGSSGNYRVTVRPLKSGWQWIASQIAASFADFLAAQSAARLKLCPNSGCKWLFYDETRANVRRWCNDRRCGNRDKVRRLRARRAADAGRI